MSRTFTRPTAERAFFVREGDWTPSLNPVRTLGEAFSALEDD
ncbi:MAG: hypothetical protein ABI306_05935 [Caulobacteraceae bacterium]